MPLLGMPVQSPLPGGAAKRLIGTGQAPAVLVAGDNAEHVILTSTGFHPTLGKGARLRTSFTIAGWNDAGGGYTVELKLYIDGIFVSDGHGLQSMTNGGLTNVAWTSFCQNPSSAANPTIVVKAISASGDPISFISFELIVDELEAGVWTGSQGNGS